MIRRPPRSTQGVSSAASDVYKRQVNQPVPVDAASHTTGKQKSRSNNKGSSTPVIVASIVFALSMLFVLMFLLTGSHLTAVLPGIAAIGCLIFLFYQFLLSGVAAEGNGMGGKVFGRGPYVRINCPSGELFARQMSKLLKELQAGAVDKGCLLYTSPSPRD